MKVFRLLQTFVIFMMIVFIGITMMGSSSAKELSNAYLYLLGESAGCGIISAIVAILILRAKRVESFSLNLFKLMLVSLIGFTIVWGLGTYFAELHAHVERTLTKRIIRVSYGYFAGWFMVILGVFVIQLLFLRQVKTEINPPLSCFRGSCQTGDSSQTSEDSELEEK